MPTNNKNTKPKSFRCPHILAKAIEENIGLISPSEWIISACKQKLQHENEIDIDELLEEQQKDRELERNNKIKARKLAQKEESKMKKIIKKNEKLQMEREILALFHDSKKIQSLII